MGRQVGGTRANTARHPRLPLVGCGARAIVPAGRADRRPDRREPAPPPPARAGSEGDRASLRPPGACHPRHRRRPDDPRLHRHGVRQDGMLPLPHREPMPASAGRSRPARHQCGHRLSDECPCGRPAHAVARPAGGHRDPVRDLRRQDPRRRSGSGRRAAAGGFVAGRLRSPARTGAARGQRGDGLSAGRGLFARSDARYVRCVPIELKAEDEGSVAVVAELVEVIGPEPPAEGQADS